MYLCLLTFLDNGFLALAEQDENALPLIARRSIRDNYDGKKTDLLARLKEQLLGTEVKLEADYDAIWQTIVAGHKVFTFECNINPHADALQDREIRRQNRECRP